jgi:phosphoribosylformylglycinamidine synthase subunit PurS
LYKADILVTLRKSILDPQGKTVEHSIKSLGYNNILDTRIGKYIELKIDVSSKEDAESITKDVCSKLLANPVMEDYSYNIIKIDE